jgi:hypothetical protein
MKDSVSEALRWKKEKKWGEGRGLILAYHTY